jgi:hypothetical protein
MSAEVPNEVEVIEVVNTIEMSSMNNHTPKGEKDRERFGTYLGMADLAFLQLVEAGGNPDTVSMAASPGVRTSDGAPVVQVTFRAFRPAQTESTTK